MGKFGCKQIGFQTLVAQRGKQILAIYFSGSEYFAQRLNWFFDENVQKSYLGPFLATWVTFFALFGSYGGDLGGTFGSNVPLALLIDQ